METIYHFFSHSKKDVLSHLGKEKLIKCLKNMLLIRHFETRAEAAYLQGKIGGFFHSYIGQEAIQTAAVAAIGEDNWWSTSYRCHALALLLGATPSELMAELFGKANGNAKGRGGSMHMYTSRLLGGSGIVGGQLPLGTGAAFSIKYMDKKEVSVCFMGDGAVAQGAFHESLNLASLWDLPCIYVIENNQWSMGTPLNRSVCVTPIAESKGASYGMKSYTIDGMDLLNCYAAFKQIYEETLATSRPVLVEAITERFRGHSVSDPGLYRSKEDVQTCMQKDPIKLLYKTLIEEGFITEGIYEEYDKEMKKLVMESLDFADASPWPDPITLGDDVFAP
ncbi:MAG: pyruvate dehydrogenase (acetyl-transferring) E1 component subunit alpha [Rhabdochlamydiaceae bacterium]